MIYILQYYT